MFAYLKKRKIFLFGLGLCLVLVFTGKIAAQPGETRTFEEIEKDLLKQLTETNKNIEENSDYYQVYISRGKIYYSLFLNKASRRGINDEIYVINADVDFTKAIELVPKSKVLELVPKSDASSYQNSTVASILSARAKLYETLWKYQFYRIPETAVRERLEHIYQSMNFTKAAEDYEKALQLASDANIYSLSISISNLYKFRGELYVYSPELLEEMRSQNRTEKIWQDFDTALKYAETSAEKKYGKGLAAAILLKKGEVAFASKNYQIALEAYLSDEKHLGKDYEYYCTESRYESVCNSDKRVIKYTFSFRRAAVYAKLKNPEKVLAEMEVFFSNVFHRSCPEPFLLRAQAYRQIGQTELAEADEKYAKNLPPLSLNSCSY